MGQRDPVVYGDWTPVSSTESIQTNEPPAKLVVKKFNDGDPTEVLSETLTSAQADVGGNFRQVDHKYIYNLEASSARQGRLQGLHPDRRREPRAARGVHAPLGQEPGGLGRPGHRKLGAPGRRPAET